MILLEKAETIPLVVTNRVSKAHFSITFSGTPVKQRAIGPIKVPFFTNIQGLCQDVFHQAKEGQ